MAVTQVESTRPAAKTAALTIVPANRRPWASSAGEERTRPCVGNSQMTVPANPPDPDAALSAKTDVSAPMYTTPLPASAAEDMMGCFASSCHLPPKWSLERMNAHLLVP